VIALAAGIVAVLALAFLLMFAAAVRLPTPRAPELDESREAAEDEVSWENYLGAPYEWCTPDDPR
jgi:hypothetical protein